MADKLNAKSKVFIRSFGCQMVPLLQTDFTIFGAAV